MHEKKKLMIEVGMRLFANKGFHSTSIQEIADQCGVSKGAFYLHFRSKDDLVLSIYQYYQDVMKEKIQEVESEASLSKREKVEKQIQVHFEEFLLRKEFIIMHLRENFSVNDEINDFIFKMRKEQHEWLEQSLLSLYGDDVHVFSKDAVVMFEGLITAYLKTLIFEQYVYDFDKLASFITRRLDDLVQGLKNEEFEPPLTSIQKESCIQMGTFHHSKREQAQQILTKVANKLGALNLTTSQREELLQSVQVMKDELEKEHPQKVVLQGMLVHLKVVHELDEYRNEMSTLFNLQLL